ncbi:MAG TPA: hypothetical protein VGY53_08445 [Isosphaeraceae bacterium]|nr:hypothetical protein [Isosphaeraceae bacterium]
MFLIPIPISICIILLLYIDKWIYDFHKHFGRPEDPQPAEPASETARTRVHSGKPAATGPALSTKATAEKVAPAARR